MYATLHQIDGIPGPQDTAWVDEVLGALGGAGRPVGTLVMRPLGPGAGQLLALWSDETAAAAAAHGLGPTGTATVGASSTYEVDSRHGGVSTGPARYVQLLTFEGPRSAEWTASYLRAGEERMWPAARELPGLVEHLGGRAADGSCFSVVLAESVEAIETAAAAIMSTELLPGENPAHLSGPDAFALLRLLHADLPVGANR